jgi:hypothetical protein
MSHVDKPEIPEHLLSSPIPETAMFIIAYEIPMF